jgi:hypothetical protein
MLPRFYKTHYFNHFSVVSESIGKIATKKTPTLFCRIKIILPVVSFEIRKGVIIIIIKNKQKIIRSNKFKSVLSVCQVSTGSIKNYLEIVHKSVESVYTLLSKK